MVLLKNKKVRGILSDRNVRSLVRSGAASVAIKCTSAALTYVMFVLIARVMAYEEFGWFSIGFNVAALFAIIAGLGLHISIMRWIPEYTAADQRGLSYAAFSWSLSRTVRSSVAVAIAVTLFSVGYSLVLGDDGGFLRGAALLVVPLTLSEFIASSLRADGSLGRALLPKDVIWRLGVCCLAAFMVRSGTQWSAVVWLCLMAGLLGVLVIWQIAHFRKQYVDVGHFDISRDLVDRWKLSSRDIWLSGVLYALMQFGDVIIVGLILDPVASGLYFAVTRTGSVLALLLTASNMFVAPKISALLHGDKPDELRRVLRINSVLFGAPSIIIFCGLLLFGRDLLGLFGSEFRVVYVPLLIYSGGQLVHAVSGPISYIFHMSGHERRYLEFTCLIYLLMLLLQIILTPLFGISGAAMASAGGYILWNALCRHYCVVRIGLDPTILNLVPRHL